MGNPSVRPSIVPQDIARLDPGALLQIGRLKVKGADPFSILGLRTGINAGTPFDLTELGVGTVPVPAVAAAMELVSSNAADDGAPPGTGVQQVEAHVLDADYKDHHITVVLNGVGAVPIQVAGANLNILRVNDLHAVAVGSGGVAAGNITLQGLGGGTAYARISAGNNRALQAHFTVPAGKRALLVGWLVSGAASAVATHLQVLLRATAMDGTYRAGVFLAQDIAIPANGVPVYRPFVVPRIFPAKTDIKVTATRLAGAGDGEVSASFDMLLEPV